MHIFLTFFERFTSTLTTSKKKQALGALPQPHSHLRGHGGRWQTLATYPYGECWVVQGVKGKMHDFVAPSPWG